MIRLRVTCLYCDNKWVEEVWNSHVKPNIRCEYCSETKHIKVREESESVIDYYTGCPPFPPKPVKEEPKIELEEPPKWRFNGFGD